MITKSLATKSKNLEAQSKNLETKSQNQETRSKLKIKQDEIKAGRLLRKAPSGRDASQAHEARESTRAGTLFPRPEGALFPHDKQETVQEMAVRLLPLN